MLSVLTQILSNLSQHVMVDGFRSKLANVVSGVPQGSALIGYADGSTLIAVAQSPGGIEWHLRTPQTVTSARVVSGVTFVG